MNTLEALEGLVSGKLNIIKTVIIMMKLEARLAGKSIFPLLLNVCMLLGVFLAVWLSVLSLVGYLFIWAFGNILLALFFILILNIGVLLGLVRYLQFNLNNMSFEKTRNYFSKRGNKTHENIEKKINDTDYNDGKKIAPRRSKRGSM